MPSKPCSSHQDVCREISDIQKDCSNLRAEFSAIQADNQWIKEKLKSIDSKQWGTLATVIVGMLISIYVAVLGS